MISAPFFLILVAKYHYWHDSEKFWSLDNLRTLEFPEVEYDDAKEDQNVDMGKLLTYPPAADDLYASREDSLTENDAAADEAVRLMYVFEYRLPIYLSDEPIPGVLTLLQPG